MVLDIWKKISKKQIDSVYLLYGTEAFLINETKQLLIEHVLDDEEKDFNLSVYDLEETPIEAALEDAETFPFMGEKRLVILQNPIFLTSEKSKGKVEHNLGKLEEYLSQPAPYSIVVFSAPYEKLDERKKITKELKRKAAVIEAKKLTEQELVTWVNERATFSGVEIEKDAIELLLSLAGTNLFMLTSEIDKLALYAGESRSINKEIVDRLTARSLEQNIFTLVDKVVHRNVEGALRIYYDLLKQNEEPIKILSVITGQIRLIYQVKELSRKGYGQQQIAGTLKIHPFRVKLAAGQAGSFSDEELMRIIKLLADADYQMKTGGMRKEMLIEMILFQINGRK
ncbi:DNA polymerase III subunit delta [Heyndrickxia sp. MSNUG]|uniref:DNA polymerase III subunit delta n=1 Tax=Heyndrickxia sp. MSNUG TaxID=3136677 RepID=UPI003C2F28AF